jgi:hypothetical protein
MYAIFDIIDNQLTDQVKNKTLAWDAYLAKNPGVGYWHELREDTLARLRRAGYYCDYAYNDMPKVKAKSKAKPKPKLKATAPTAAPAVIKFEQKVEKTIVLDLAFAKAMHTFFKRKQSSGEIEYIYEYKSFGSEGDAKKLLEHMTEFFNGYTD